MPCAYNAMCHAMYLPCFFSIMSFTYRCMCMCMCMYLPVQLCVLLSLHAKQIARDRDHHWGMGDDGWHSRCAECGSAIRSPWLAVASHRSRGPPACTGLGVEGRALTPRRPKSGCGGALDFACLTKVASFTAFGFGHLGAAAISGARRWPRAEATAPPARCAHAPSTAAAATHPPRGPQTGGCASSASSSVTRPSGKSASFHC